MTVNNTFTSLVANMQRGGWPGNGAKIGIVENTFATDLAAAANDVITAINFVDDTIVLLAWAEVNTKTTSGCNMSLGKADGAELMDATAIEATTGLKFGMTTFLPVLFAAADTLDCHFSASGAGGNVTVRALVLSAEDTDGSA